MERELHMSELANKQLQESVTILRNTASERPSVCVMHNINDALLALLAATVSDTLTCLDAYTCRAPKP